MRYGNGFRYAWLDRVGLLREPGRCQRGRAPQFTWEPALLRQPIHFAEHRGLALLDPAVAFVVFGRTFTPLTFPPVAEIV